MNNFLAGQTNSPISFPDNYPRSIVSGKGSYVTDADGTQYIDLWMGYGALLHGHQHETEKRAVLEQLDNGWFFSYPTKLETLVAEKLHDLIPSAERIRFSVSGSDAVAYAIRASRQFTNRLDVLAIDGGYHGVHENMVSNTATLSRQTPDLTLFNDTEGTVKKILSKKYACFILEPILANNGCVPPQPGYLEAVRTACTESGTVLIFDEVVVGFRTSLHGAQSFFGVTPDLSTFSKAIAGGFPLSAVVGKQEIMEQFLPTGEVFFAGTFNGSPISLANSLEVLKALETTYPYKKISQFRQSFSDSLLKLAQKHSLQLSVQGVASMMSLAFGCDTYPHGVHEAKANADTYTLFADYMANHHSILLPPLFTETIFLAPVHMDVEQDLLTAFDKGFEWLAKQIKD
jgi:glutamate-1-semialdehyde 2,1-aminomutase